MANFVIYNYQFARVVEPCEQYQLKYPDWENRRTRQTLWGECTDANPKTVAKRYTIEKKLVPLQYES